MDYQIIYSRRKTLALCIKRDASVFVYSPNGLSLKRIETFVESKKDWLLSKLKKRNEEKENIMPFINGKPLWYLGEKYILRISDEIFHSLKWEKDQITISSHHSAIAEDIIRKWYQEDASGKITQRVEKYAEIMDLSYSQIKFSNAKCTWGSCTSKKNLLFNWRLLQFPLSVIDYVVIHELAHLKQANHSQKFWDIVKIYCPEHKKMRKHLRNREINVLK